jgi:hypothetical protein
VTDAFWLKWIESRTNEREEMIRKMPLIEKKQIDHKLVNMYLEDLFFTGLKKFKADLVKEMNEKRIEEPAKSQVMDIIGI